MSFVVYIAVILVAAASALFGLDLLTAPLPPKPPAQVASTSTPSKISQREAEKQQADKQANNRALSPVYPANPAESKPAESKDGRMVSPPAVETSGASRADAGGASAPVQAEEDTKPVAQAAVAPQQPQAQPKELQQPIQPAAPQTAAIAPEQPAAPNDKTAAQSAIAAAPAIEPVAQQTAGRCDVQTCTSAYSSFRASDCTYQPFSGPRRVCGKPSAQKRVTASARPRAPDARAQRETRNWDPRSWDARRNPEVDDAVRSVRRMPYPDRDDDADIAGPVGGRRTIMIERGGRFWP
jgi:hypothetical protein